MKLKDRIAIITGATSGIGEASALLFAAEGAKVTVTGRDDARGRNVVAAIAAAGGTAVFVRADVRLPGDCERIVAETLRAFGGLKWWWEEAPEFDEKLYRNIPQRDRQDSTINGNANQDLTGFPLVQIRHHTTPGLCQALQYTVYWFMLHKAVAKRQYPTR